MEEEGEDIMTFKENNKVRGERTRGEMLEFIRQYLCEHGYPPSRKEIGDGVGLRSTSSVQQHIDRMLADGILETDVEAGSPRALRIPGMRYVNTELTIMDRYLESERKRIMEELCPYDVPWLAREMGEERLVDKDCMNECEQCWGLPLKPEKAQE